MPHDRWCTADVFFSTPLGRVPFSLLGKKATGASGGTLGPRRLRASSSGVILFPGEAEAPSLEFRASSGVILLPGEAGAPSLEFRGNLLTGRSWAAEAPSLEFRSNFITLEFEAQLGLA